MKRRSTSAVQRWRPIGIILVALLSGACGTPAARCDVSSSSAALTFAELADSSTSTLFLDLGDAKCTAIAVDRRSILTAAHCVPASADAVQALVLTGVHAEHCVGSPSDPCAAVSLTALRYPSTDVALLQADVDLAGIDFEQLPWMLAAGSVGRFRGYGYGEGAFYDTTQPTSPTTAPALRSTEVGTTLLVGEFENVGSPAGYIKAYASRSGSVCDGDSGGPAIATIGGRAAVAGVLYFSEGREVCTPEGGAQLWSIISTTLPSMETALEDCVTLEVDSHRLVGCGRRDHERGACGGFVDPIPVLTIGLISLPARIPEWSNLVTG